MYDFKMALFDNFEPVEFFLFKRNYQMKLEVPGSITSGENIQ